MKWSPAAPHRGANGGERKVAATLGPNNLLMVSGSSFVIFIEEKDFAGCHIKERCLAAEAILHIMTSDDNRINALGDQNSH